MIKDREEPAQGDWVNRYRITSRAMRCFPNPVAVHRMRVLMDEASESIDAHDRRQSNFRLPPKNHRPPA